MRRDSRNSSQCRMLKEKIHDVNFRIQNKENKINSVKKEINSHENQKRELKRTLKNKMTQYGVSLDFVTDAFIPNPFLAIAKATSDYISAPKANEIESSMQRIADLEEKIQDKNVELMRYGSEIRELVFEKDDLVRQWRSNNCVGR